MSVAKGFIALLVAVTTILILSASPGGTSNVFAGAKPQTYTVDYVYFTHTVSQTDVIIEWMTTFEENHAGFFIHRTVAPAQPSEQTRVSSFIPGEGGAFPTPYTFLDDNVPLANTYFYWIEAISLDNQAHIEGPELVIMPDCAATITSFEPAVDTFVVNLSWESTFEDGVGGYAIWRADNAAVEDATSISSVIPAAGGGTYQWRDTGVSGGSHYNYWVETRCDSGAGVFFGPRSVDTAYGVLIPLVLTAP